MSIEKTFLDDSLSPVEEPKFKTLRRVECKCTRCGRPFPYRFVAENLSDRWTSPEAYEVWAEKNINYCPECQEEFLKKVYQSDPELHPDVSAFEAFDAEHFGVTKTEETVAKIEVYKWGVSVRTRPGLHAEALELINVIREEPEAARFLESERGISRVAERQRNFLNWHNKSGLNPGGHPADDVLAKDPTVENIAACVLDTTGDIDLATAVYLEDTHPAAEVIDALRNPEFFKLLLHPFGKCDLLPAGWNKIAPGEDAPVTCVCRTWHDCEQWVDPFLPSCQWIVKIPADAIDDPCVTWNGNGIRIRLGVQDNPFAFEAADLPKARAALTAYAVDPKGSQHAVKELRALFRLPNNDFGDPHCLLNDFTDDLLSNPDPARLTLKPRDADRILAVYPTVVKALESVTETLSHLIAKPVLLPLINRVVAPASERYSITDLDDHDPTWDNLDIFYKALPIDGLTVDCFFEYDL